MVCPATERLSLAELRSATSCLEAVFLSLFHSWVSGQETCFLQNGSEISVCLEKSSRDSVTDCTSLSSCAAAANIYHYVELIKSLSCN